MVDFKRDKSLAAQMIKLGTISFGIGSTMMLVAKTKLLKTTFTGCDIADIKYPFFLNLETNLLLELWWLTSICQLSSCLVNHLKLSYLLELSQIACLSLLQQVVCTLESMQLLQTKQKSSQNNMFITSTHFLKIGICKFI